MSRVRGAWTAWVALTSRRETAEVVALFRIGVGLSLLIAVGTVALSGVDAMVWTDAAHGGYRGLQATWLVEALGGPSPAVIRALMTVSLGAGAMLSLGLGGRITALIALQAFLPLTRLNTHSGGSYEHLLTNALWLLVLAGPSVTWSLDCRLRHGRWTSEETVGAWARGLILAQIVLVYATTGLQKLGAEWGPLGGFSAVWYALRDPAWYRFDLPWLGWLGPALVPATAAVWLFEVGWALVPLLLWWRRGQGRGGRPGAWVRAHDPRPWILGFGLALHAGIATLMSVGAFSLLTLSFYVALWRPEELRAALRVTGGLSSGAAGPHREEEDPPSRR